MEELRELLKFHVAFAKRTLLRDNSLTPMLISCKDDEVVPICFADSPREVIHALIQRVKSNNPEWMVFMTESYMKEYDARKTDIKGIESTMRHGDLKREFNSGFKNVKEAFIVNAYYGDKKLFVTYEVKKQNDKVIGFEKIGETDKAEGFLI